MPRPLRNVTDNQLYRLWARCSHDEPARKIILSEARRRDTSDKDRAWWADMKDRWMEAAHAQFETASAACKGVLLSREGRATLASEFPALWEGNETRARRLASPELNEWWDTYGRITVSQIADDDKLSTSREHIEQQRYERTT